MNLQPTAVVVGAGLGGLAAAARLARHGYAVTILEKNATPGGRCGRLVRDGHRFDTGPTLLLMREVFAETYRALGERLEDHLDLRRIDPTYRIRFDDGLVLALTRDPGQMRAQLEAIEPGSYQGLQDYLAEAQRHYRLSLEHFVGRNFYSLADYLSPANLPLLFRLKALVKHYQHIGRYLHDPRLKAAFTFQDMYLGLSPFDAPATYSLLSYTELAGGVWFPLGGLYRVVESLAAIAQALGVQLIYNAPVQRIESDRDRVTRVVLEDGTGLAADVVVANADLPYVYRSLLGGGDDGTRVEAERLKRMKYTSSSIMFYWGVDRVYPQLDTHNVFLSGDYQAGFQRIFDDLTLPDQPSFYVHAPKRVDPAAAPADQDSLYVLVPVGHLNTTQPQDWEALRERARQAVFQRLAQAGVPELASHLKFEVSFTPRDWQSHYQLEKGAGFGLSHDVWQVGYLRPHNRHARLTNLYFVGSSTHPGTGLPMVLLSARLVVERILAEVALPQPVNGSTSEGSRTRHP
jgi:phytoene desaturase